MNAFVLTIVALILSTSPNRAAGQESVLGVWEIVDDDIVTVMSFRDDGIMVQNEFFDGELECVFVFPYEVDGDQLTLGRGLTWEVDPETGDLVPVEDLDELSFEVQATLSFSGDELVLTLGNEGIAAQILAFVEQTLGLDPVEDLGLVFDGGEVGEAELAALVQTVIRVTLADLFGIDPDFLPEPENAELANLLVALANAQILTLLGEIIEFDLISIGLDVTGELDIVSLLLTLQESLELDPEALAAQDIAEIEVNFFELEDLTGIGTIRCVRSERSVLGPPGEISLPNGRTAIQERSWGQVKREAVSPLQLR